MSSCKLNLFFPFKDILKKKIRSAIVCRYTCSNCKVTCYGKTYHHFCIRAAYHMDIFDLTLRRLKCVKQSAISGHLLKWNSSIVFVHFDILASERNENIRLSIYP